MRKQRMWLWVPILVAAGLMAAEDDEADLSLRLPPHASVMYLWNVSMQRQAQGYQAGKEFSLTTDSATDMNMLLKAQPPRSGHTPVSLRLQDTVYREKHVLGKDATAELFASKGKIRYTENERVLIDSEKSIGLERLAQYQQQLKAAESREMNCLLDAAGRPTEMTGDPELMEMIKSGGVTGIFPLLPGKPVRPGASWTDTTQLTRMGEFRLARPALVRNKMTFRRWEIKDEKRVAVLEFVSTWDNQILRGEHANGLLVELSKIDGHGSGTCYFDPATGRYLQGTLDVSIKYRIDGEQAGQTVGLDASATSRMTFTAR